MILWVRHGQSTWNVFDRMQGQAVHPPLTFLGHEQAAAAAANLVGRGVTRVLSSPAVRAAQTAQAIANHLGLEVEIEPLLIEKGLEESMPEVLGRVQQFLALGHEDTVVAVSHGDMISLAVGMLSSTKPVLPDNGSITAVDPHTRVVEVIRVAD